MTLSPEQIKRLLKPSSPYKATTKPNAVDGPCRYYESEFRCASRGCSSPTHYKIEGTPRCYPHAIVEMNDLCLEMQEVIKAR